MFCRPGVDKPNEPVGAAGKERNFWTFVEWAGIDWEARKGKMRCEKATQPKPTISYSGIDEALGRWVDRWLGPAAIVGPMGLAIH